MAQSFIPNELTRVTSTATWTEVAGATKGLSGFSTGDVAEIDVFVQSWNATDATVLFAVTSNSTAPAADTDAFYRVVLSENGIAQLQAILTETEHLWVKSDQTDVRVNITGSKEDN